MSMYRPAIKLDASNGGSDIAGETAAALAAGYIVFQDIGRYLSLKVSSIPYSSKSVQ